MNSIDIKVSNYFPFNFQVVGYGFLLAFMYLILYNWLLSLLFLILGLLLTTTHYRLEINGNKKYFREYLWIFGIKYGDKFHFQDFKNIVINSSKRNFEYGSIAVRRYGVEQSYMAFLKFTDQKESALIGKSKSLKKIESKALQIKEKLGIPLTHNLQR